VTIWGKNLAIHKERTASNPNGELYEELIATIPGLERKGDVNPYTSMNGNMFTLLHQSERYGAVMKYVAVPDALLKDTKALQKYLEFSYEYAKTPKPKPTRKKS
jgi:hypothetical protein